MLNACLKAAYVLFCAFSNHFPLTVNALVFDGRTACGFSLGIPSKKI